MLTWININKCSLLAEMTTKFNKDMYAQMRSKKDEPLFALETKSVRITERGAPILATFPSTPTPVTVGMASPTLSVEELTPRHKRPRTGDKQKEKVDCKPFSIWDDAGVSMARAQVIFNMDNLKVLSRVPTDEVVRRHFHKLVQVPVLLCLTFIFSFSSLFFIYTSSSFFYYFIIFILF